MRIDDYAARTYAGVLGKIIGVYWGRPVEQWSYERIVNRFGSLTGFVSGQLDVPLVVTDDDISGTFTFVRTLEDYDSPAEPSPAQIGHTWLNYLIEGRTILWWGGSGNSTEHTAFLQLKCGHPAPESGSAALNGDVVANQIGAMIFIDGWAMTCPGEPDRAARLAKAAASVSHDLEAVNAAVMIAVMESMAFVESDLEVLVDAALSRISGDSAIAELTGSIRKQRSVQPDWRATRAWLEREHGYHRYPGICHVMPNFGLIMLALLYGAGDFRDSLSIVSTSGWDTDCNAANLGCLLGIRNGLGALEACPDLRRAFADKVFISSADGGRGFSDAAREALALVNYRQARLREAPLRPKGGVRFPFAFPGAVHGFGPIEEEGWARDLTVANPDSSAASHYLDISLRSIGKPAGVFVQTAKTLELHRRGGYGFQACPTLYPGQHVRASLRAAQGPASLSMRWFVSAYDDGDRLVRSFGPSQELNDGAERIVNWEVPESVGFPIVELGLSFEGPGELSTSVRVDWVDWKGVPSITFRRPSQGAVAWSTAWVQGVDEWATWHRDSFLISQNEGTGLLIQGHREWTDYEVEASIVLWMCLRGGVAARVQGMRRYYCLALDRRLGLCLIKERDGEKILWSRPMELDRSRPYNLRLAVAGNRIRGYLDGVSVCEVSDESGGLASGAAAFVVSDGTLLSDSLSLRPLDVANPG